MGEMRALEALQQAVGPELLFGYRLAKRHVRDAVPQVPLGQRTEADGAAHGEIAVHLLGIGVGAVDGGDVGRCPERLEQQRHGALAVVGDDLVDFPPLLLHVDVEGEVAPAGLAFYYARLFPQWRGSAFVGGLVSDALIRIGFDGKGGANEAERWDMGHRIRDVKVGPDGALWLLEDEEGGRLLKLTPKR